jgi:hypothetical protein
LCDATNRRIRANLLKRRAFCAARARASHGSAQRNTFKPPGLDIDGMSNRKKRKFSFETL